MTFVPKEWKDLPDETTPLDSLALKDLETRVTDYADVTVRNTPLSLRILADNPIGYWRLGEGSNPAVDLTGNVDGAYRENNFAPEVVAGLFGQPFATRLHHDPAGVTTAVTSMVVPRNASFPDLFPGGFTVELLWRVEGFPSFSLDVLLFNLRFEQLKMIYAPTRSRFEFISYSAGSVVSAVPVTLGKDYHVVVSYTPATGTIFFYLNGTKRVLPGLADVLEGIGPGYFPNEASIEFGATYANDRYGTEQAMSDCAVYNRPLTDAEVAAHYADIVSADTPGDLSYVHNQLAPGTTWNIAHNLGKKPSITISDSAGTVVVGDIHYVDDNNATLTFSAGFGGKAYCN